MLWIAQCCGWHEQLLVVSLRLEMLSISQGYGRPQQLWVVSLGLEMLSTTQGCGWPEQLWIMSLRVWCYEQLIVVDDMNDSVSYDLRPSEAMNHLGLWMLITILQHTHKPLYAMNNSRLWMLWTTLGCEFKALNVWTIHSYGWQEEVWVVSLGL